MGNTVTAGVTNMRVLESVEANIALIAGATLGAIAALAFKYPRSIAFPIGVLWHTFKDPQTRETRVQESKVGEKETTRTNYALVNGVPEQIKVEISDYDPRKRPHYQMAVEAKKV